IAGGAAGYILKGRDTDIIPAVIWVHQGGALMSAEAASRAYGTARPAPARTPRFSGTGTELDLLARIGRGLSDKEIARELRLKSGTVRSRVSALLRKTGLRSRTEMALFARRAGIPGDGAEPAFPPAGASGK
ncbi:MAG: response regulator transcription factor, partial [Treponema sp.]|nr:response regulator transcription factor [Treponema sp.]